MKKSLLLPFLIGLIAFISGCEEAEEIIPDDNSDPRDAFVGSWNCSETELKSTEDYEVTIDYDPNNSGQVLLKNFGLLGQDARPYGLITGNKITIPEQDGFDGWTIMEASGDKTGDNTIEWTYKLSNGSDIFNYEATYTRVD